ncbi:S1C family serine protease [Amycolatopsis samaneae]|uniref:S1C family serine protease n=1 Tax=Amycolatopsis samaneae TaxID=664691 RepID=A0ABW5GX50_9PSEU
MTENESRPGPASTGGHQPHQNPQPYPHYGYPQAAPNPLFTQQPPTPAQPKKGSRVAALVGATALAAALLGGAGGAAVVGLTSTSAASPTTSASPTANGQPVANVTGSGDISGVAAKVTPSVVQVNVTTQRGGAIGSGVVLTADGRILTNAHVVSGAAGPVTITTSDGKKYQADVGGADTKADIAVLQVRNGGGFTPAAIGDSGTLAVGQSVIAIGSPGGLQGTVTTGIISALNRSLSDIGGQDQQQSPYGRNARNTSGSGDTPSYTAIQTDASINQGNSGGPLIDGQGRVIGINSAIYSPVESSNGAAGSVGIGFAIPINDAMKIVNQIVG